MFRLRSRVFWAIYLTPFLVGVILALIAESVSRGAGDVLLPFFAAWLFLGPWISRRLVPMFVSRLSCPGCAEEIDPIAVWGCSCGYRDHKPKHVLGFKCRKCGGQIGHINCPKCEASLLL